ncbi:hypothetical protein BDN72DRAFT_842955 [Pluteus cervinus]|uniref:Uncharacterized protein n=1 Tax=Pluteus cervinus TaxID=181527 RepID=A0ACD3AP72_9AGAR|nr:hypothetical protein BDN72DRAFT_842955 [Pluteus cervinus]
MFLIGGYALGLNVQPSTTRKPGGYVVSKTLTFTTTSFFGSQSIMAVTTVLFSCYPLLYVSYNPQDRPIHLHQWCLRFLCNPTTMEISYGPWSTWLKPSH